MASEKGKCHACNWGGSMQDVLVAPSPFDPSDTITGCPKCKDVNSMYLCCDEPGCWERVCAGTPTDTGYRQTCHEHRPLNGKA